jgi:Synaptotagmin-like mitochondrial-lipid-binding domain
MYPVPRSSWILTYCKIFNCHLRYCFLTDYFIFYFSYGGDCDITFSVKGVKAGIKDFQVSGLVRIVMKPLLAQMPLIGGMQVFFLNNPDIDFNLVGIADVLDFPGLRYSLDSNAFSFADWLMVSGM